MARSLNGAELAGFIKERQAKQVRALRQAHHIVPHLLILMTPGSSIASEVYVRLKQRYAEDILVQCTTRVVEQVELASVIQAANQDTTIQGIIVQLPLDDPKKTDEVVNTIAPHKDVDGLGNKALFTSATADAINWLCGGYSVALEAAKIAVVGQGRLVGAPLTAMWQANGYNVTPVDITTADKDAIIQASDVIVTAVGSPRTITSAMVKHGAVVIDAGSATEGGVLVGDVGDDVRERSDVSITPVKGGVGPLTIAVLFDHLIQSCLKTVEQTN